LGTIGGVLLPRISPFARYWIRDQH